jgi:hypothetical protein
MPLLLFLKTIGKVKVPVKKKSLVETTGSEDS